MQLLLISSSFVSGLGYIEHAREAVIEFLGKCPSGEVIFVPYASHEKNWDSYSMSGEKFFANFGQPYRSIHIIKDPGEYLKSKDIKAIFVGGGNTFVLLKTLQDKELLEPISQLVKQGSGYMGTSAGSNLACPTIQTTNDMPVVEPSDFRALGLVPFQINPHFVPGSLVEGHKGETREQRISEYHQFNESTVIGLPETTWVRINDTSTVLGGEADATIFRKDQPSYNWYPGKELRETI